MVNATVEEVTDLCDFTHLPSLTLDPAHQSLWLDLPVSSVLVRHLVFVRRLVLGDTFKVVRSSLHLDLVDRVLGHFLSINLDPCTNVFASHREPVVRQREGWDRRRRQLGQTGSSRER